MSNLWYVSPIVVTLQLLRINVKVTYFEDVFNDLLSPRDPG